MGVESRETLGIGEYTEMGFTSENVSLPDGRRISLCSTGNYAQDRAGVSNCPQVLQIGHAHKNQTVWKRCSSASYKWQIVSLLKTKNWIFGVEGLKKLDWIRFDRPWSGASYRHNKTRYSRPGEPWRHWLKGCHLTVQVPSWRKHQGREGRQSGSIEAWVKFPGHWITIWKPSRCICLIQILYSNDVMSVASEASSSGLPGRLIKFVELKGSMMALRFWQLGCLVYIYLHTFLGLRHVENAAPTQL